VVTRPGETCAPSQKTTDRPAERPAEQKGTNVKITVDEDKCCAAGSCVMAAPEVFDQRDEDGIVVLLDPQPAEDQHQAVRDAAAVCPAAAIAFVDA
jgi:ferredoxin